MAAGAVALVFDHLSTDLCRQALAALWASVDDPLAGETLEPLRQELWKYIRSRAGDRPAYVVNADATAAKALHPLPPEAAKMSLWEASKSLARLGGEDWHLWEQERTEAQALLAGVVRCIIGHPYRPAMVDSGWLTSTVMELARGIYDERAFDRLPILADALMDAGCDNTDVLCQCREVGPHVRGCWVIDLVLGKS